MSTRIIPLFSALCLLFGFSAAQAAVQSPVDQADPSVVVKETRGEDRGEAPVRPQTAIQREAAAPVGIAKAVLVGAVRVDGAQVLPQSAFAAAIQPYLGRELAPEELRRLASDVADVARGRGYGLATAWIPPQHIAAGVIHIVLDEGRIDEVHVEGPAAAAVERKLAPLVDGKPVATRRLERHLLIAEDMAGVWLGKARLQRSAGHNILFVTSSRDRVQIHAFLDNWGSSTIGPVRARLAVDLNGLIAGDDRLSIGGMVTPLQPKEFVLASLVYAKPVGASGLAILVDGYVARSQAGSVLRSRRIVGRSAFAEAGLQQALLRSRAASAWATAQFGWLASDESERGERFRQDRIASASASLFAVATEGDSRLRGSLALKQGLAILGATERGVPLASRPDAGGRFTKFAFWAALDRKLDGNFSIGLQAQGQIASGPLLSSEEMGLGGAYFLRGYDYREYSGDKGIAASAELRFNLSHAPRPLGWLQLYFYADAGSVGNYRGGYGSGSLASAGGGVRANLGRKLDLGLEIGVPLKHGALPEGHYDPRLSFTIGAHF